MKAEAASGAGAMAASSLELPEPTGEAEPSIATELQELSIADASNAAREADVEEEEQYVQVRICLSVVATGRKGRAGRAFVGREC